MEFALPIDGNVIVALVLFIAGAGVGWFRLKVLERRVNHCSNWRDNHDKESSNIKADIARLETEISHCATKEDIARIEGKIDALLNLNGRY